MKQQYNNTNQERNKKKEQKKIIIYKKKCTGFGQPTRLMGSAQYGNKMLQDSNSVTHVIRVCRQYRRHEQSARESSSMSHQHNLG